MAATCKAVVCETISASATEGIAKAVLTSVRRDDVGEEDVRIQVRSASINFPELLMMQNKYQFKPTLPFVLCTEGAGVVVEVGKAVRKVGVGDRVMFSSMRGCCREDLVVPEAHVVPLPAPLSFSQGAGFLMGYTTGYHALVTRGRLRPGEWLLVTGAGGGMGAAAVQLGRALGARVIAAASSEEKLATCRALGAEFVVNYATTKLKEAVAEITGGAMCDVIYEPVGGEVFDQCVRCVATGGYARLLVVGFAGGTIPKLPINMALIKGFDLVGVRMGAQAALQPELYAQTVEELVKMADAGSLAPHVSAEFPVERYREAFTLMEQKKVIGKCCITFDPSACGSAKL